MEYRLLGPMRVRGSTGQEVSVPRPKHRQVLAALLSAAGRVVTTDHLIGHLWDDAPPPSARGNIKTYVSALRRLLSPDDPASAPIETIGDGYRIVVGPGELDLLTFADLVARGRGAVKAGDVREAGALFQQALELWHGRAFEGIPVTVRLAETVTHVEDERVGAFEDWIETRLALGMHAEVIGRLRPWLKDHPLRERPWGQMMLALARDGRRAEALSTFQQLRTCLVDELGVEPGFPLQELHRRVLAGDPGLFPEPPAQTSEAAGAAADGRPGAPAGGQEEVVTVPRELPSDIPFFVGRQKEIRRLESWLNPPGDAIPSPVVAICGPPGSGKSALALRVAHMVAGRFPDGQVYVNLRGAMPGVRRLDTSEVLGRILRAFGTPGRRVPSDVDEAAAALRTLLHGRRALILLDDAASVAQVGPVVPMTSGSVVLLTSRESLAYLAPASQVNLGRMSHLEAATMLTRRFRSGGVEFTEESVQRLVLLCDRLPLALHVAGARLASRSNWSADTLIERLHNEGRRLDELHTGEGGVRGSIAVSYAALAESAQAIDRAAATAFRLMGTVRVPELGVETVATLLDVPAREAEQAIERLADANLIDSPAPGRYTMHDLVRLYAQERAVGTEPPERRTEAVRRVLGLFIATATAAARLVHPHRVHAATPDLPQAPLPLADVTEAERWLHHEQPNMLALIGQTWDADEVTAALAAALTLALQWHFYTNGYRDESMSTGSMALAVTRRLGDRRNEAHALSMLYMACQQLQRDEEGIAYMRAELKLSRELGDLFIELRSLGNLAARHIEMDLYAEALEYGLQQLAVARRAGSAIGERYALMVVGHAYIDLGRIEDAVVLFKRAREMAAEVGDGLHEAKAVRGLGVAHLAQGDALTARTLLQAALGMYRLMAWNPERASTLTFLARCSRLLGDMDEAFEHIARSLEEARRNGNPRDERKALDEQAEIFAAARLKSAKGS
ncbi:BTAD domain-containing putative transcriptional regulator [Sphaerisporangium sp. NPDC051011]|uniref:AfsR/SARP family transcriptional regulator n=1 Tax=Sphaerisporangium sp. NPDC051011 TaxID=3155792 RepID=UPI0033C390B2